MAGPLDAISQRAEEILGHAGDALGRVADELPGFARLLRSEPRLRAALTDIARGAEAKKALLDDLLGERLDTRTMEVVGLLAEEQLSQQQLEHAAADVAVRSILAWAEAEGLLDDVEDELFRFARVIRSHPELRSALTDPSLPAEAKVALVGELLEGKAGPQTVALAGFVLERRVERDPATVLEELAEMAATRRGRVVVEARTAVPIDLQRQARLADALSRTLGRGVDLEVVVDPGVVGGVIARVGDELIDGTVKRKLQLALEELTA